MIREIYRSPDRQLQIGEEWTEGGKGVSTPVLVHDASHLWAVVLAGKVQVVIEGEERVLRAGEAVHVPPGTPHQTAPLTNDVRVLLIASPEVELPK